MVPDRAISLHRGYYDELEGCSPARKYRKLHSSADGRVLRGSKMGRSVWLEKEVKEGPWLRVWLGSEPGVALQGVPRKNNRLATGCMRACVQSRRQNGRALWKQREYRG